MDELFVVTGDCLFDHDIDCDTVFMAETKDVCKHYPYHTKKLVFFLAAMRHHRDELRQEGFDVRYHDLEETWPRSYAEVLETEVDEYDRIVTYASKDHNFTAVEDVAKAQGVEYRELENPNFLTPSDLALDAVEESNLRHDRFYRWQRKRLDVLIDGDAPVGGKWSFDSDNRKALKDTSNVPSLPDVEHGQIVENVKDVINRYFDDHIGGTDEFWLPVTRSKAESWYDRFLEERFANFGPYQDALNQDESFAYHSVISPMLNIGLLDPQDIVDKALTWYEEHDTPLNSVEGFIRQVIGWREFIKAVYDNYELRKNYFNNTRGLTQDWYNATTGIPIVDDVIEQVMQTGYAHHIQRLMVLSNIMLLLEVDPDEVNAWFMECFVDSADWVMEPNVYDMGQYATGGLFATKPYISSSNYIEKMSDYPSGDWCKEWDALYWSFLAKHRDKLEDNNRMKFMYSLLDKKDDEVIEEYRDITQRVKERITAV